MFTRFANPHALDSKVEVVSRKALILDDTGSTAGAAHDDALLTELNLLLKRSLGDVDIPESVDEKARKKRRKIEREHISSIKPQDVDGSNPPVSMPFRLVSRTLPPKEIDIDYKTIPVVTVREPQCEDNEEEAERRRTRAQQAAVDMDWLLKESQRRTIHRTDHDRKLVHVKAKLPSAVPPVVIIEKDKPAPNLPKLASAKHTIEVLLSPHTLRSDVTVPVVPVTTAPEQIPPKKSSRNIRRARAKAKTASSRPPATFWRPLKEWGVKAAGYSVGYEGSWPVFKNDPARYQYQRDTMRKGVFAAGTRYPA